LGQTPADVVEAKTIIAAMTKKIYHDCPITGQFVASLIDWDGELVSFVESIICPSMDDLFEFVDSNVNGFPYLDNQLFYEKSVSLYSQDPDSEMMQSIRQIVLSIEEGEEEEWIESVYEQSEAELYSKN
jgi:hypothetical protein